MRYRGFLEKLLNGASVEWKPLRSVADILNGYAFKSTKYSESGIRVVRISDVQKGQMSQKDLKFYPSAAKSEIERYMLFAGDLVMSLTGNCGRVAMLSDGDLPAALNQRVACLRADTTVVLTRYLFHYFDQVSFEQEAMGSATGGGQKNMSTNWLGQYPVPITCPEDPEKSLAMQAEIVRILDSFTELTAELTAELKASKQQYNHYRHQLLSFDEGDVEWMALGELTKIKTGQSVNKNLIAANPGEYPVINSGREPLGFINDWNTEGDPIGITSRGAGVGSVTWREGKYFRGNLNYAVTILDADDLDVRYLYHLLELLQPEIKSLCTFDGIPALNAVNLKKLRIPVPSKEVQIHKAAILDKFDTLTTSLSEGLPREIKLRQQQYEYYRELLLSFPKPEEAA